MTDQESLAQVEERWKNRKQNEQPYREKTDLWYQDAIRLADAYSAASYAAMKQKDGQ